MMDVSTTIIPKSDQINFEDVQSQNITAVIKAVRRGNSEQPVFIDLVGYDGRPYKPSKSMRRVLVEAWGSDGHSWAGRSLTLYGDPTVKYGGVTVGGIKISAMSHIEADFSLMLSISRGKRVEHRVKRLETPQPQSEPQSVLMWFTDNANSMNKVKLDAAYNRAKNALSGHRDELTKLDDVYKLRASELTGSEAE